MFVPLKAGPSRPLFTARDGDVATASALSIYVDIVSDESVTEGARGAGPRWMRNIFTVRRHRGHREIEG
jgi:hypothetical protein